MVAIEGVDDKTALSRYIQSVVAQITLSRFANVSKKTELKSGLGSKTRFAIATTMRGVIFIVTSLICRYFQSLFFRLATGGPLAAKRTIHGSHTWSGGPSTAE